MDNAQGPGGWLPRPDHHATRAVPADTRMVEIVSAAEQRRRDKAQRQRAVDAEERWAQVQREQVVRRQHDADRLAVGTLRAAHAILGDASPHTPAIAAAIAGVRAHIDAALATVAPAPAPAANAAATPRATELADNAAVTTEAAP